MSLPTNVNRIVERALLPTLKKVATASELFSLDDVVVGDKVFVNDRNVDFELISNERGQYIDIEATNTSYTNRLIITGATLTASGFNVLPQNTVIEVWARIATGSDLPVAAQDIRLNNAYYFGFYESSGSFRAAVHAATSAAHLELNSVEDEDGVIQDPDDLEKGVWYKLTVTVIHASGITISSGNNLLVGCMGQAAETSNRHYHSLRITKPDTSTILWDFEAGSLEASVASTAFTVVGTVPFEDNELLGNDLDLIEQASPYLLYRIKPIGGYVTPENFGAVKQYNNANIDAGVDATEAIQACIDSPYNVLIDGYYYTADTLKVATPKLIQLLGSSDGTQVNGRDETLGCLYQGTTPADMFHIFSGGVNINGGLIDFRNCIYDTDDANLAAYYVQPRAFRYCFWANLIQGGSITTTIIGDEDRTKVYNGGHVCVGFDNSRVFDGDPETDTNGYGEMHYVDFKIEGRFLHSIIEARLGEPYQDYTDIIGHSSMGGFKVTTATLDEATDPDTWYISTTTSDYAVINNAWRILTLKWGTSSHFTIKVTSNGTAGNLVDKINQAIVDAGYSTDTSLASTTPAFKAESRVGGGTNQAFTIRSNQSTFKLTCCRPCLPTVFNYDLRDIGCKMTGWFETADNATMKLFSQTAEVLGEATEVIDGSTPNEYSLPKLKLIGSANRVDIKTVDLGKVGTGYPDFRTNLESFHNSGDDNQIVDNSIDSLNLGQAELYETPANISGIIRNHRHFSHTRYHVGTGRDGFIGALDNVLMLAHRKWTVTSKVYDNDGTFDFDQLTEASGLLDGAGPARIDGSLLEDASHATIQYDDNLFDITVPLCTITYGNDFDEELDFIEIVISGMTGNPDFLCGFLELSTINRPRRVQLIAIGNASEIKEYNLVGSNNDWLPFDGFNSQQTTKLILRLIGVKDKSKTVQLAQLAGSNKAFRSATSPFVSIAGGNRVYGQEDFDNLRLKDAAGDFEQLIPQAEGTITTVADVVTWLKSTNLMRDNP